MEGFCWVCGVLIQIESFQENKSLFCNMKLTAIIEKSEDGWYVGQVEEFPAALSQGKTIGELKANLLEAFQLLMEANKVETEKDYEDREVIRENLVVA